MPLSINVGLSRKASRDYQSAGVSINVTAELDSALLSKPDELQGEIDHLYHQCEQAIARQTQRTRSAEPADRDSRPVNDRARNGNGRSRGDTGAAMTASQRRAVDAIATRAGVDPAEEASNLIGIPLDRLTLKQASELIDHLKALEPQRR